MQFRTYFCYVSPNVYHMHIRIYFFKIAGDLPIELVTPSSIKMWTNANDIFFRQFI